MANNLFPCFNTIFIRFITVDIWILHSDKCYHPLCPDIFSNIYSVNNLLNDHFVIFRIIWPFRKTVTPHQRYLQTSLSSTWIVLSIYAFNSGKANIYTCRNQLFGRHRIKCPTHNRLANSLIFNLVAFSCFAWRQLSSNTC